MRSKDFQDSQDRSLRFFDRTLQSARQCDGHEIFEPARTQLRKENFIGTNIEAE